MERLLLCWWDGDKEVGNNDPRWQIPKGYPDKPMENEICNEKIDQEQKSLKGGPKQTHKLTSFQKVSGDASRSNPGL